MHNPVLLYSPTAFLILLLTKFPNIHLLVSSWAISFCANFKCFYRLNSYDKHYSGIRRAFLYRQRYSGIRRAFLYRQQHSGIRRALLYRQRYSGIRRALLYRQRYSGEFFRQYSGESDSGIEVNFCRRIAMNLIAV